MTDQLKGTSKHRTISSSLPFSHLTSLDKKNNRVAMTHVTTSCHERKVVTFDSHEFFRGTLKFRLASWIFLLGMLIQPCWASESDIQQLTLGQQRIMFQQARDALKSKDTLIFQQLAKKLSSYPLMPYLDIWQGYEKIIDEKDRDVAQILARNTAIPENKYLRMTWLKNLAKRGQWPQVSEQLTLLHQGQERYPNIAILSNWYNGRTQQAIQGMSQQWRHGQRLPEHTKDLMTAWHAAGHPNHDDQWARVVSFAKHGQWKDIDHLKHYLNVHEQQWIRLWHKVKAAPEHTLLTSKIYHISPKVMAWISKDGLRKLASSDIERAWLLLQRIKPQLNQKDVSRLQRYLALRAAKQHHILANTWLLSLTTSVQNKETRAWLVRTFLLKRQWKKALYAIQSMPEAEQIQSRWLYWQGYVLEKLKQPSTAQVFFKQAALERGYYSFLSAKHLQQPYRMNEKNMVNIDTTDLLNNQAIQRAYEWRYWGKAAKADAEWSTALQGASQKKWLEAMQLAIDWGWYKQVIRAANYSKQWNILSARFPMAYTTEVTQAAHDNQLKSSMIWGIIRQESGFNPKARSRTGARGLMQLMPATAQDVLKKHHIKHPHGLNLSRPQHNIELGSLYIADMLKRFNGQQALAIAAYNAGPNRVARWQKSFPLEQEALWIELIPFNETRRYVQHVLAFIEVYDWLQQQSVT